MSGGPEIRLNSAVPDSTGSRLSPDGKRARAAETSAPPFEAVLAGAGAKAATGKAEGGEARPLGRFHKANVGEPRMAAPTAPRDGAEGGAGQEGAAEVATLGPVQPGESLAGLVAERITASLGQATAKQADDQADAPAETGPSRSERSLSARLALAMATVGKADRAGAAPSGPAFSVTKRETHFGPVLAAAGAAAAAADGDGDAVSTPADADGSPFDAGPGAVRQGRAEQVMIADRAAAMRGPAKVPGPVANVAARPAAEETKPAGPALQPGGDGARGTTFDGAFALTGGSDARAPGPASIPVSGAPATQPVAAPPGLPASAGPVKVLHIQLHPAELGMLEVRMKLGDAGLELHIAATRHETLALLKSDQDALASVLRGAGHSLDAVSVSFSEKSGASGQQAQDGWQPPASGGRPDTQSGSPQDQGGRFDDRSSSRPESGHAFDQVKDDQYQPVAHVRPRGSLYL